MSVQTVVNIVRRWGADIHPVKALVDAINADPFGEVALDPAALAAGVVREDTVALPAGTAKAGALVFVQPPANLIAGLVPIGARISADDVLAIKLFNPTAGALDSPAGQWTYQIMAGARLNIL